MIRPATALLLLGAIGLGGCPSAYDRTYQKESQRLEEQQRRYDEMQRQQHEEARRFAAVVYFASGSAELGDEGRRELDWFVEKLEGYPMAIVEVRGFTDSTGSAAVNQRLSQERARNVAGYLLRQGIASQRIDVQSFGASIPAQTNQSAQGRKNNRRVEVTIR